MTGDRFGDIADWSVDDGDEVGLAAALSLANRAEGDELMSVSLSCCIALEFVIVAAGIGELIAAGLLPASASEDGDSGLVGDCD